MNTKADAYKKGDLATRLKILTELIMSCIKDIDPTTASVIAEFATPLNLPMLSVKCEQYQAADKTMGAHIQIKPDMRQMTKLADDPLHLLLCVDVSGSMQSAVTTADKEEDGFTILDIVKHAASTIVESLNENHRVTLISFSSNATTIFSNLPMSTKRNKKTAQDSIKALRPQGATNLWEGLRFALEVIKNLNKESPDKENMTRSEVLIFTDGMPNRNPPKGIIHAFNKYTKDLEITEDMFSIRTFGFGYSLDSELLEDLAKYGRGTFNFIPDASFVGTVFIHAVADLLSGVPVKNVELWVDGVKGFRKVDSVESQDPRGKNYIVGIQAPLKWRERQNRSIVVRVPLGNVGSGQVKDIFIKRADFNRIYITYTDCRTGEKCRMSASPMPKNESSLDNPVVAACELRTAFCALLTKILKSNQTNRDHYQASTKVVNLKENAKRVKDFTNNWQRMLEDGFKALKNNDQMLGMDGSESEMSLDELLDDKDVAGKPKPVKKVEVDENTRALRLQQGILSDLKGQVSEAVSREDWFKRWGIYYLRSLRSAHQMQYKNNFKDEGIKQYGGVAFSTEVERVNKVFDSLPPPEPSARRRTKYNNYGTRSTAAPTARVNMAAYNNSRGPCFGAETLVLVAGGNNRKLIPCSELRKGDTIVTGSGETGRIRCVIETVCSKGIPVLQFEDFNFSLTPWHPVLVMGRWSFPAEIADKYDGGHLLLVSRVFNFILEEEAGDHTILLNGQYPSVLLGHGQTDDAGVLNHAYFANYGRVVEDLSRMQGWSEGYVKLDAVNCLVRDPKSRNVNGLVGPLCVE